MNALYKYLHIRYTVCQYSLPLHRLPFHSTGCFLCRSESFTLVGPQLSICASVAGSGHGLGAVDAARSPKWPLHRVPRPQCASVPGVPYPPQLLGFAVSLMSAILMGDLVPIFFSLMNNNVEHFKISLLAFQCTFWK